MTTPITITNQAALEQGQRVAREREKELPDEPGMWWYQGKARIVSRYNGDLIAQWPNDSGEGVHTCYILPRGNWHKAAPPAACDKCERLRAIRDVLPLALKAIDEAYEATGHIRVAKTSAERQAIEAAILSLPREVSPAEQYLRQLPAAKAGQDIKEAAADEIRRLRGVIEATARTLAGDDATLPEGRYAASERLRQIVQGAAQSLATARAEAEAAKGALEWCLGKFYDDICSSEDAPAVFVESGGDDVRVDLSAATPSTERPAT